MYKNKSRAGVTMIEIIFTLGAMATITIAGVNYSNDLKFESQRTSFFTRLDSILNNAVMDSTVGYLSGSDGNCSSSISYEGITADRVVNCVGWDNMSVSGIGENSYITNVFNGYSDDMSQGACVVKFRDDLIDNQYNIFIDCSNINYDNQERNRKYMEDLIVSHFYNKYSTIWKEVYLNASDVNNTIGGDSSDAKVRFLMEK